MQKQATQTNIPNGEPIKIYREPRYPLWVVVMSVAFLIGILVLITAPQNWIAGNFLVFFVALILIRASFIYWNNLRTKVERYQDALVIYSTSEHNVFYFTDIVLFSSEYIERAKGLNYTQYTLQRLDGVKMSFPNTLEAIEELLGLLETKVGEPKSFLEESIEKLKRGEKIVFSQFTVTAQGITAENGEFRAWSDINIGQEGNNHRLVFRERNKPALMGGQAVWAPLPKQNTSILEKLVYYFQANQ